MTAKTRQADAPPSRSARRGTAYSLRYRDLFSATGTSSERIATSGNATSLYCRDVSGKWSDNSNTIMPLLKLQLLCTKKQSKRNP
jgi:hypothetical protein